MTERHRKALAALARKKHRDQTGTFLLEGVRTVEAAVQAGAPLVEVVVTSVASAEPRVETLLVKVAVPIHTVSERMMAKLSDVQTSQGILAVAQQPLVSAADLFDKATVLALDGVQDPGNVGTVLRTAAWFGVDAVLAGPGTADLFNPKVVRASMGGLWDVRLARTQDLWAWLGEAQARGFTRYGADLDGTSLADWQPQRPSVLVLGSEAHGLQPAVHAALDECLTIPSAANRCGVESLNVGVAGGILMSRWVG